MRLSACYNWKDPWYCMYKDTVATLMTDDDMTVMSVAISNYTLASASIEVG